MMLRLNHPILVKHPLFLVLNNHARKVNMAFPIAFTGDHERTGPSQSSNFKFAKS